ncbi:alpha-amylase family glycosyl hydrolase [Streptomyces sp. NPDC056347]|uniref:glycoside hydrolase family 13 protein n=1 Tax=Streptomyces sp. NPDC056347 TaxID=3345790 RepID=UPI0035DD4585
MGVAAAADWWQNAVIYQVYLRSFRDSDGDGIGDLRGVRSQLDYLVDLGVDALWITPFYTSPMADGGYDVADYRDVDPSYGTLADFQELLADAHQRGLRVIVDVVPNHASSQHPWFVEALAERPGGEARGRFHFREGKGEHGELPPNNWPSIFGGPAWTRVIEQDGQPGQWYLHLFTPQQPDLNWENPQVRAEFEDILRFWLDLGVDGFRIDVANGMAKAPGYPDRVEGCLPEDRSLYLDRDDVHDIHRAWRRVLDTYGDDRIAVAEAWVPTHRLALYLRPDELHQAFNFPYIKAGWSERAIRQVIEESLGGLGASSSWVLSNHDEVRPVTRFGGGASGLRRARAAALLMLALPGSAYIYQGDELGLPEVVDLPDDALQDPKWERSGHTDRGRDGCRVPLPWSGTTAPYGFGPAGSAATWLPQPDEWASLGAQLQAEDQDSSLILYRRALQLRRTLNRHGDGFEWLDDKDTPPGQLSFRRGGGFVCTVNFGPHDITMERPGELLLASAPLRLGDNLFVLPADTAAWWHADNESRGTEQ